MSNHQISIQASILLISFIMVIVLSYHIMHYQTLISLALSLLLIEAGEGAVRLRDSGGNKNDYPSTHGVFRSLGMYLTYLIISRVALAIVNVVRQWTIPALREPMTEALSTKQGSGYWYKVWPRRLLGWNLGARDATWCVV